ncbi:MAG: hypothetical protein ACI4HO_01370 [Ruminococcus sp.]
MKINCPYCGRRIPYTTLFHIKKQGTYECTRCKKRSKVKLSSALLASFIAVFLLTILFIIVWCTMLNMANNFFGVILAALILIVYYFFTPFMVTVAPIKEYMDKGKKHSPEDIIPEENQEKYIFNREAFDEIKRRKNMHSSMSLEDTAEKQEETRVDSRVDRLIRNLEEESAPNSRKTDEEQVVPIIENVSQAHASSSDEPLHKVVHHQRQTYQHSYEDIREDEDIKIAVPKKKKMPDGTKYTANRKL